jgi:transposase-like protein
MDSRGKRRKQLYYPRQRRIFDTELKRKLVEEIEHKRLKVRDVVNLYRVSTGGVYCWIKKYSSTQRQGVTMVVESDSKDTKTDKLLKYIAELEQSLGKKQLEIDYLNKVVDICSDKLGYDVKKKNITMQLSGSE